MAIIVPTTDCVSIFGQRGTMEKQKRLLAPRQAIAKLVCTNHQDRAKSPLMQAILCCAWMDIQVFLSTGLWNKDYGDSTHPAHTQAEQEATYLDSYSHERVRQLPLHAAIFHLAPLSIVRQLARLYPNALGTPDNHGNLPLHIAFMTNAKDVSCFLLRVYPSAMMMYNHDGELPVECGRDVFLTLGPSPMEVASERDKKELQRLELQVAKDKQRMTIAEAELNDLRKSLRHIQRTRFWQQQSSPLVTEDEYRTGTVDL